MSQPVAPIPDRVRLPLTFDVERLQREASLFTGEEWIGHFVRRNYAGNWSVIPLRGPAKATHPVMMIYSDPSCSEFSDTTFLDRARYLAEVIRSLCCPVHAVRLMKLSPGLRINEHTDFDLAAEFGNARLHVPIHTNEHVLFRLNGKAVPMAEGECWYLRLSDPHSVSNRGATDRVHLVIDVQMNVWLDALLRS